MKEQRSSATERILRAQRRVSGWSGFVNNLLILLVILAGLLLWQLRAYAGSWEALLRLPLRELYFGPMEAGHRIGLTIRALNRAPMTIDLTEQLLVAGASVLVLWILQSVVRGISGAVWRGRVRTHMVQMEYLARETRRLGQEQQRRTGVKVDNLQDAIDHLSPIRAERLHTGDPDLEGLENAVNDLLDRMQEAYAQQTRFVSDASHELRTPIAVLKGYADMLERWGKDDPKVLQESVDAIQAEAGRMSRLVEQLLFLARGDSGRTKLNPAALDLSDLIREVGEESAMIHPAFTWQVEADRPVSAVGDRDMLKEALRILADNAAKYTPAGKTITLKALTDGQGRPTLVVRDQGMGISQEDLPHVFDRFYRSDPARTRQHGGAGLGLSIADWIADSHGGTLEVYSWEGVGSRFSLILPKPEPKTPAQP